MEFSGQTAIVTGAARGFGRAITRRLARGGARIVAADINLPGAEETAALVTKDGGQALVWSRRRSPISGTGWTSW
jgi:3-oxoacyl-[acyl-carrier protein] reductase